MNAAGILHIDGPAEVQQLVAELRVINPPDLAIFEAVATGDLTLVHFFDRIAEWPAEAMESCKRPTIISLYDGGLAQSLPPVGPSGWGSAPGIARWAKAALILVGLGEPKHYSRALLQALVVRRLAIVHTTKEHAPAWYSTLGGADTLLIWPDTKAQAVRPRVLH